MQLQHPFKILRAFLRGHPDLKKASTQEGFAKLVDCSRSLIRAVEQGQTRITERLAEQVVEATGVSLAWLTVKQNPTQPIPAAGGGILTHQVILGRIEEETERNLREASSDLLNASKSLFDPGGALSDASFLIRKRMASTMAKVVEEALLESLSRGDTYLMEEITRLLARMHRGERHPPD
ncbi:MAG: XRE family transcriptional regulator [Verrucomicrobiaceae bacterium]|nr:MAG: XRE family transcriptional regulator [Verrucomicrobiaceae bacterium]